MTESHTRPTPRLLDTTAVRADTDPAPAAPYNRGTWEQAVRYSDLHPFSRLLAMMLAHYADGAGHIPSSDILAAPRLAKACNVSLQNIGMSLNVLYRERYLDRGPVGGHAPRSVTLTLPPSYQRPALPHSPGEQP